MPAKVDLTKDPDFDNQLYLLIERDFPMLKKDVEEIKESLKTLEESNDADRAANQATALKLESVSQDVKDLKTSLVTLTTKQEMPWYKDFQKILILLFAVGFMILAGVKAYEEVAKTFFGQAAAQETTQDIRDGS